MRGLTDAYGFGFRKTATDLGVDPDVLLKFAGPRPGERSQVQRTLNRPETFSSMTVGGKAPPRSDDPYCGSLSALLDSSISRVASCLPRLPVPGGKSMPTSVDIMRRNRRMSDVQRARDAFSFRNGLTFDRPPVWKENMDQPTGVARK